MGDSLLFWSLLLISNVPCNKVSIDVNGGGLELVEVGEDGLTRVDEINVGLERTEREKFT